MWSNLNPEGKDLPRGAKVDKKDTHAVYEAEMEEHKEFFDNFLKRAAKVDGLTQRVKSGMINVLSHQLTKPASNLYDASGQWAEDQLGHEVYDTELAKINQARRDHAFGVRKLKMAKVRQTAYDRVVAQKEKERKEREDRAPGKGSVII